MGGAPLKLSAAALHGTVRKRTDLVAAVWYTYYMIGHFHRGVRPLRSALRFGNESGLISTVSPPPGFSFLFF
jgi:hypothetical protein